MQKIMSADSQRPPLMNVPRQLKRRPARLLFSVFLTPLVVVVVVVVDVDDVDVPVS